ncbi:MAG: SDR family NAD(P)-dependent oxidoreductase [Tetrasphaera sp.]
MRCASATDVAQTLAQVHRDWGSIRLLIHAAGLNRSTPLVTKPLDEFRRIRDLKVRGHVHLAAALAGSPPGLWLNFGSLLGMTGQAGEADYASANDFLGFAPWRGPDRAPANAPSGGPCGAKSA